MVFICFLFSHRSRFEVGDWIKFKRSMTTPTYGWQGAKHSSVGFVQSVPDKDNLLVSFCSGEAHEARVLANEVIKVIPLDRGQHVQLKSDIKEPRFNSNQFLNTYKCNWNYCTNVLVLFLPFGEVYHALFDMLIRVCLGLLL